MVFYWKSFFLRIRKKIPEIFKKTQNKKTVKILKPFLNAYLKNVI